MLDAVVFYSLLAVIALVAIPYGTVEPWWKSVFQCAVFLIASLAVVSSLRKRSERYQQVNDEPLKRLPQLNQTRLIPRHYALLVPLLVFLLYALIQTIAWSHINVAGIVIPQTLSADPFQTRLFAIQLIALVLVGWLLLTHLSSQRRLRHLVAVIIGTGVFSAAFGLWRQTSQPEATGFLLPYLRKGFGYGQFINSNHFAFLMEMALGLSIGIVLVRAVKGWRLGICLASALLLFVALVFANSRGGIFSVLCQLTFFAAWLVPANLGHEQTKRSKASRARQVGLRAVLILLLLVGGIVTVVFVGGDPLAERVDTVAVEFDQKTAQSYTLRQNIWQATWSLIKAHPVVGVGFGGYATAITRYHRGSGEATPQEAHSDYLELVASGGIVGLLIALWAVVAFLVIVKSKLRQASGFERAATMGALAGIFTVAVHSLVDFGLHISINGVVFTALIAIVLRPVGEGGE